MTRAELDLAVDWAAGEGWNPGLTDAGCFYLCDRRGFLMGFLDGEPVAAISVVAYDEGFGFLGFYLVKDGFRGRGFGWALWQAGMAYLDQRVIGLDGVVDQQEAYKKSGFVLAHRNIRHGGRVSVDAPGRDEGVVDMTALPQAKILAYDKAFFPADRGRFMTCWLNPRRRRIRVLRRDGEVAGFGVLRPCREGYKIGPLFAEDEAGAELLFRALAATAKGAAVYLDTPDGNAAAVALAERHGLKPISETARMYKGEAPDLPLERTFGITTFELG